MPRPRKAKTVQHNLKNEVHMEDGVADLAKELEEVQTQKDLMLVELENSKRELEELRLSVKNAPARQYDKQELEISEKQIAKRSEKAAANSKIEAQKAYDNQKVTGKFINRRAPGQPVKLPYIKYADDPVKWWPFEDGKVYTIPRGFADQINEHYHTPKFIKREGVMNPDMPQSQIEEVDTSNKKYAFMPVNF